MNPVHEELLREFTTRAPHMRDAGLQITTIDTARASMSLPDRPQWLGDPVRGLLHAGPSIVLADSACGLAVASTMTERVPIATLDLRMDYLRSAAPGQPLHCDAHCFRKTRNVAFVRAEVWQARADEPVAMAQAAFMISTPGAPRPPREPPAGGAAAGAGGGRWQPPAADEPVLAGIEIPYVEYLGIRATPEGEGAALFRLPFQDRLIGNPMLPALHGGVVAGFAETAATLHLIRSMRGAKFPKCIDFSIDYLRSGRPEDSFASCEVMRLGARVALVQVRCWQSDPAQPITVARGHFLLTAAA
ncbi:MAG: hotdog fold thioesterase [Burkholderiales bacterium]|nr:hotdog fold thioesterase [Burkholderiales bacterium]